MNESCTYWKVVLRYGHVGKRREISVARYLLASETTTIFQIHDLALQMPGVKHHGVLSVHKVTADQYVAGKLAEEENFYLQRLLDVKVG